MIGVLRRGLTVDALMDFIVQQGPSKAGNLMEWDKLWALNKQAIDPRVPRYMAVAYCKKQTERYYYYYYYYYYYCYCYCFYCYYVIIVIVIIIMLLLFLCCYYCYCCYCRVPRYMAVAYCKKLLLLLS